MAQDQAAGVGSSDKAACLAERPQSVTDQSLARLHAEIEEAHYAVNSLEAAVEPVTAEPSPDCAPSEGQDAFGSSPHVRSIHAASENVMHLITRVRAITRRLEV